MYFSQTECIYIINLLSCRQYNERTSMDENTEIEVTVISFKAELRKKGGSYKVTAISFVDVEMIVESAGIRLVADIKARMQLHKGKLSWEQLKAATPPTVMARINPNRRSAWVSIDCLKNWISSARAFG